MSDPVFNLGEILIKGAILRDEESRQEAWKKRGTLRGGSTGLLFEDGTTAGCPRAALARYLGADPPRDPVQWAYDRLMLDAGNASEDLWASDIRRALEGTGIRLLQEEEFPIRWTVETPSGAPVPATGREDLVLVDERSGEPRLLGELKLCSALNTAVLVVGALKPKFDHLIQSANYSLRVGAPVQLWYVSRVKWSVPSWPFVQTQLANPHARVERFFERGASSGKISSILPFAVGFQIFWDGEFACAEPLLHDGPIEMKGTGKRTKKTEWVTPISKARIDAFYKATVAQAEERRLFPSRPTAREADGRPITRFSPCDYCDWQFNCDANENDYDAWEAEVLSHARVEGNTK